MSSFWGYGFVVKNIIIFILVDFVFFFVDVYIINFICLFLFWYKYCFILLKGVFIGMKKEFIFMICINYDLRYS